jgi:hypothetical protein
MVLPTYMDSCSEFVPVATEAERQGQFLVKSRTPKSDTDSLLIGAM